MGSVEDIINAIPKEGMSVLLVEEDFYDLAMAYFTRVAAQNRNSFEASWLDDEGWAEYLRRVDACAAGA